MNAFGTVGGLLLGASIQAALVIGLVWTVCRLVPRMPASVRSGLWWLASLKLLLGLLPIPALSVPTPVETRSLPRTEIVRSIQQPIAQWADKLSMIGAQAEKSPSTASAGGHAKTSAARSKATLARRANISSGHVSKAGVTRARLAKLPWTAIALGVWGLGAFIGLARLRKHLDTQRRLLRQAVEWDDRGARAMLEDLSDTLGLRRTPRLLISTAVDTPQVSGLLDPAVVVPERLASELTPSERAMTLCHELVHLRRHDLWLGWVPALAERIFWFHPLARLATREYALAREAACDAEVIRLLEEAPQDYGRMLIRIGTTRWPGLATAGVAPTTHTLRRRLLMLQHAGSPSPRRVALAVMLAIALLALVPLRFKDQPRAGLRVEPGPPEVLRDDSPKASPDYYVVSPEPSRYEAASRADGWSDLREVDAAKDACPPCDPSDCVPKSSDVDEPDYSDAESGDPSYWTFSDLKDLSELQKLKGLVGLYQSSGGAPSVVDLSDAHLLAYAYGGAAGPGSPPTVWAPPAPPTPGPTPMPYAVAAPRAITPSPAQMRELDARFAELRRELAALQAKHGSMAGSSAEYQELAQALAERAASIDALGSAFGGAFAGSGSHSNHTYYSYSDDGSDHCFVLMKGDTLACANGNTDDFRRARRFLRRSDSEQILYFREGADEYIIDDPDFLSDAWRLFDEDTEESRAQQEMSARQAELGAQQAELGRQQAELALRQAEMGVRVAQLQTELIRRSMDDKPTGELERNMEELQNKMSELGDQQSELGDRQSELGDQQSAIGDVQSRIGDQESERSEERTQQLWDRLEQARKNGVAREAK